MKKLLVPLFGLILAVCPPASAQNNAIPVPLSALGAAMNKLTKFNLDFPGGTPGELTTAIQKALGRPLNVVVPSEHAAFNLPPLKMTGVNVAQLFTALESSGTRRQRVGFQMVESNFGFRTNTLLPVDDDSIWTFYAYTNIPPAPKMARFYLLSPYIEAGLTVDDITTAIQTSWRMLDEKDPPTLSFHKETKLLIAVGEQDNLAIIEAALKTLDAVRVKNTPAKPAEEKKTKQ